MSEVQLSTVTELTPSVSDAVAAKLESIYLLQVEIARIGNQRDTIIQGVYDQRLSAEDVAVMDDAKDYAIAHIAPLQTSIDSLTADVTATVMRLTRDIASDHMIAKYTLGRKSGASIDEIKTFSRMLPPPFKEQALSLIKEGKPTCKIVSR